MHYLIRMICIPLLALSVTVAKASQWEDPTTGIKWNYNEHEDWCEIYYCDHCYGNLEIPSEIAGLEVRSIEGESFIGCSAISSEGPAGSCQVAFQTSVPMGAITGS